MPTAEDPVGPLRLSVQHALDDFTDRQRALLEPISAELLPLLDAAAHLLRGGKRLRPAFCYWGWRASGGSAEAEAVLRVGASLELFQAAALVHDDLIDGSDTRRGKPSVHRRFRARHHELGWRGDSDAFGATAAILLGDLLLGWSDELLSRSGLTDDALRRARPVFEQMRTEVGAGQYLDVLGQVDVLADEAAQAMRARQVLRHKSARYSVQHPLVLGARIADAPEPLLETFATYGAALGEAFQLRDDVLGVFGDPTVTGKPAGDDLREGKRTLLVAYALQRADAGQTSVITKLLGDAALDPAGVEQLRQIFVDTGAVTQVEAEITALIARAATALEQADLTDDGRAALTTLINLATARSH